MTKYIQMIVLVLALCLSGCREDILFGTVPEGEEATVTLQVELGGMTPLTRADMSTEVENRVNNLWIGVYNKETGQRTTSQFFDNIGKDYPEDVSGTVTLKTKSGESYIVAVANYKNNKGFDVTSNAKEADLELLLQTAGTWDEYRAIAVRQNFPDYAVLDAPTVPSSTGIVLQGSYRGAGHTHSYKDDDPEMVVIKPGQNDFSGKIHLRRLWTKNTVNIVGGGDVISLEVTELEVFNVPEFSWLQSRNLGAAAGKENVLEYANAGDAQNPNVTGVKNAYPTSLIVTAAGMDLTTTAEKKTKYSYSFWQYENKHTGTADDYAKREEEYKDGATGANTGIYKALCPSAADTLNNTATYIKFKANIRYVVPKDSNVNFTPDGLDKNEFESVNYRTAEATYVVHLGYIGDDPTDFNCYRNAKYTYNITVENVNKILVEAFTDLENQTGAEGVVTDVTDQFHELDCHYNVFNIYLTKEELNNFTFKLRTYENGVAHEIKYLKDKDGKIEENVPKETDPNWKYYSWIQFVRNDDISNGESTKIAKFPELKTDGTPKETDKLYYLKDIAQKKSSLVKNGNNGQGFTVYVKEYTYEKDYGETGWGNETGTAWSHYVNQPDRTAHFNVSYKESSDKESVYFKSKYALSQKSIQTYYNYTLAGVDPAFTTALGVEHENEVFGMNIRWPDAVSGLNSDNGRSNVYKSYGSKVVNWDTFLDLGQLQQINELNNTKQLTGFAHHVNQDPQTNSVPKTNQISSSSLDGNNPGKYKGTAAPAFDPQHGDDAQYIQALHACMNRNKDENGNGKIDNAELKWYVPSSGDYLRVILGRNSLKTPIMNYEQEMLCDGCGNDANTLYHFMASDNKIIWVDEGASSSRFQGETGAWSHAPWQVRCIRKLGVNLNGVDDTDNKIAMAYQAESDGTTYGGVVKASHYYGATLREPQTTPLPLHKTNDGYNRLARYGFEIAPRGNAFEGSYDKEADARIKGNIIQAGPDIKTDTETYTGTPYNDFSEAVNQASFCETLNKTSGRTGWRVPNQKEIVIMLRMGILSDTSKSNSGDQGLFVTCSQEHWANFGNAGHSDLPLSWNYRILSVSPGVGLATAVNQKKKFNSVRCVRDLTAAEADMSYSEITKSNKK